MAEEVIVRIVDEGEGRVRQFYLEMAVLTLGKPFVEVPFPRQENWADKNVTDVGWEFLHVLARSGASSRIDKVVLTDRSFLEVHCAGDDCWAEVMPVLKPALEMITAGEAVDFRFVSGDPLPQEEFIGSK